MRFLAVLVEIDVNACMGANTFTISFCSFLVSEDKNVKKVIDVALLKLANKEHFVNDYATKVPASN